MTQILVDFAPILILLAVWVATMVYYNRRNRGIYSSKSGKSHGEMLAESIEESRRLNQLLEKMLNDHEVRIARLEAGRLARGSNDQR